MWENGPLNYDPNMISDGAVHERSSLNIHCNYTRVFAFHLIVVGTFSTRKLLKSFLPARKFWFKPFQSLLKLIHNTQSLDVSKEPLFNSKHSSKAWEILIKFNYCFANQILTISSIPRLIAEVVKQYGSRLSDYERQEIEKYPEIWYLGLESCKINAKPGTPLNCGYDDENGSYNKVTLNSNHRGLKKARKCALTHHGCWKIGQAWQVLHVSAKSLLITNSHLPARKSCRTRQLMHCMMFTLEKSFHFSLQKVGTLICLHFLRPRFTCRWKQQEKDK